MTAILVLKNSKSIYSDDLQNPIDKDTRSLIIEKISLKQEYRLEKLILDGHIFPCLHSKASCKLTMKYPYTIVWSLEEVCLIFITSDLIGRTSKQKNRY